MSLNNSAVLDLIFLSEDRSRSSSRAERLFNVDPIQRKKQQQQIINNTNFINV